jgi:hypothetical protein
LTDRSVGGVRNVLNEPSGKTEALPSFFGSQIITRTYQYGVAGKANGPAAGLQLTTGSLYSVAYGYDDGLRPQTVTCNGGTPFTYAYVTDSNLIDNQNRTSQPKASRMPRANR